MFVARQSRQPQTSYPLNPLLFFWGWGGNSYTYSIKGWFRRKNRGQYLKAEIQVSCWLSTLPVFQTGWTPIQKIYPTHPHNPKQIHKQQSCCPFAAPSPTKELGNGDKQLQPNPSSTKCQSCSEPGSYKMTHPSTTLQNGPLPKHNPSKWPATQAQTLKMARCPRTTPQNGPLKRQTNAASTKCMHFAATHFVDLFLATEWFTQNACTQPRRDPLSLFCASKRHQIKQITACRRSPPPPIVEWTF